MLFLYIRFPLGFVLLDVYLSIFICVDVIFTALMSLYDYMLKLLNPRVEDNCYICLEIL